MIEGRRFALCLTHDVDRPFKTYQALYYAIRDRRPSHLVDALPGRNPYWQFEEIAAMEEDLGVRSAFYVLNEPHILQKRPRSWLRPVEWVQHLGRYAVDRPEIVEALRRLHEGGWEIGLHGSYGSYDDRERLRYEKAVLEACLEAPVLGGRQHYLNLSIPDTWHNHAEIGLRYDASLGSSTDYGFEYGYEPLRPIGGDFVVFPLTLMEQSLPDPGSSYDAAWSACERLLDEAASNGAVMTVVWHPRYFSEADFPGYRALYRQLVQRALEMDAWVGPPADCYRALDVEDDTVEGLEPVRDGLTKAKPRRVPTEAWRSDDST